MPDYEAMILDRQDDIYDGIVEQDDEIEIRRFNFSTGCYDTIAKLKGAAATRYMEENGIW